jgi:hypothetical protein
MQEQRPVEEGIVSELRVSEQNRYRALFRG